MHVVRELRAALRRLRKADERRRATPLDALAHLDPRKARVVEMRFFGGLTVEETAEVLKISAPSVLRDWKLARAWLMRELSRVTRP